MNNTPRENRTQIVEGIRKSVRHKSGYSYAQEKLDEFRAGLLDLIIRIIQVYLHQKPEDEKEIFIPDCFEGLFVPGTPHIMEFKLTAKAVGLPEDMQQQIRDAFYRVAEDTSIDIHRRP